ncbi:hypothetical protein C8A03DRAFT_19550 [Achaetomium macrosporum]|uniref:SDR family NAD(P)-dependent oxidoreductase n=1 Tax=Achaetomium macrosporum TaxID=79813 RepID=A0AAN7C1H1_9PEZI|nr:hypothetical protein C8A03DRAFT_19550 [Achaetomium macrosporum]
MKPPMPFATATWHNATYPAISPLRPELSAKGKTIVITGAGTGIGRQAALSFANAGAARVVLLGRMASTLEETGSLLLAANPGVAAVVQVMDTTDEAGLKRVASSIAAPFSARHASPFQPVPSTPPRQLIRPHVKGT